MSGTLFVVATPIGNLEDVTLRALRVLREVDVIAAEDTRRTGRLLAHYAVSTPTISFHQHNVRTRLPQLLTRLRDGAKVALVTDAGTPGISDPGAELVDACVREGVTVDPVPGVSAPLAAAVVSGFPLIPLTIFGFPPRRAKDRTEWFTAVSAVTHTVTFFESPHRIAATLVEGSSYFGVRPIVVGRELTKLHQEFVRGTAHDLSQLLQNVKGEITVVLAPAPAANKGIDQNGAPSAEPARVYAELSASGRLTRRQAISETARRLRLPARTVYEAIERAKVSGI